MPRSVAFKQQARVSLVLGVFWALILDLRDISDGVMSNRVS